MVKIICLRFLLSADHLPMGLFLQANILGANKFHLLNNFCNGLFANCQILQYFLMQIVLFYKKMSSMGFFSKMDQSLIVEFRYAFFKKSFCRYSFSAIKHLPCDFIYSCRLFSSVNIFSYYFVSLQNIQYFYFLVLTIFKFLIVRCLIIVK